MRVEIGFHAFGFGRKVGKRGLFTLVQLLQHFVKDERTVCVDLLRLAAALAET